MLLTLIRHTSVACATGTCYGQTDIDVSSTFEKEARIVLDKISLRSFDAIYCSPLQRCTKLAEYCNHRQAIHDKRLMEMNFGDWEMQPWDKIDDPQLEHWFDNWVHETPTHGESFKEMINRVENFLDELKRTKHQQVAIFTHAGVIRVIGILCKELSIEKAFDFQVNYGDVVEFEF